MKKKFPKEDLEEVRCVYGNDKKYENYELISNKIVDHSRWSLQYEMIFKYEDKFYTTWYSKGATENQDEQPWEYDGDEIECVEVKPVEKTIIVYEEVK